MTRIWQIRRAAVPPEKHAATAMGEQAVSRLDMLEARIAHLERLVEGSRTPYTASPSATGS